jgi:hypothetical protein
MTAGMAHAAGAAEVEGVSGGRGLVDSRSLGPIERPDPCRSPIQKSGGASLLGLGWNYICTSPEPWRF